MAPKWQEITKFKAPHSLLFPTPLLAHSLVHMYSPDSDELQTPSPRDPTSLCTGAFTHQRESLTQWHGNDPSQMRHLWAAATERSCSIFWTSWRHPSWVLNLEHCGGGECLSAAPPGCWDVSLAGFKFQPPLVWVEPSDSAFFLFMCQNFWFWEQNESEKKEKVT